MPMQKSSPKQIAVLGSTGSIGRSTLDVIRALPEKLQLAAISFHSKRQIAVDQARRFKPRTVVCTCQEAAMDFDPGLLPRQTDFMVGQEVLEELVQDASIDVVVAAMVGCAGLRSIWAALNAGKRVALANKEPLVVAGPLLRRLLAQSGAELLPVDSEHSAIFQALFAGRREDVRRVILTASGGPFRDFTREQLAQVTLEQALAHPNWEMGPKISIDSATMMNKALEIVEARWLFDLEPDQIAVVIHPTSVVHSMVEFCDGSTVAQMSPPDMRMPIQLALSYPERWHCPAPRIDFQRPWKLEFFPPDLERFPAITLGLEVARLGGTAGAVMNAANEAAVQAFIEGQISFQEIVPLCHQLVDQHQFIAQPTLEELLAADEWARTKVTQWACA